MVGRYAFTVYHVPCSRLKLPERGATDYIIESALLCIKTKTFEIQLSCERVKSELF